MLCHITLQQHYFLWHYSPNLGLGLPPWNSPFHFGFLDLRQSVGLLGRVISSSQDLSLYTNTEKRKHVLYKHQTSIIIIISSSSSSSSSSSNSSRASNVRLEYWRPEIPTDLPGREL
jgi:hypothetical protein